jgi:hypothetical protein
MRLVAGRATAEGVGRRCRSLQAAVVALHFLAFGALTLALVVLLDACGDDDGGPATVTPATGTPATGTPATGTPATGMPATGTPATGTPAASPAVTGTPVASPAVTGTPVASPAATAVPGEATGWEGFQQFAAKVETALATKDVDFFMERAVFSDYTCPGPEEFTPCEQQGQVLHVIASIPVLPSEATLLETDALRDNVQRFLDGARPDLSDDYGDGALKLYSISRRSEGGGEYWALITKISTPEQSPQRELVILRFRYLSGRWEYAAILQGILLEGFGVEKYFSQAPEDLNWERRQQ